MGSRKGLGSQVVRFERDKELLNYFNIDNMDMKKAQVNCIFHINAIVGKEISFKRG